MVSSNIDRNIAPYYDDYKPEKNYVQVLFRPGYAVQAREVSQLQTAIQEQITRNGDHFFKDGSVVIPGAITVDNNYFYVTVREQYNSQDVDFSNFLNKRIVGLSSGTVATVVRVEEIDQSAPTTLFLSYKTGDQDLDFTGDITNNSQTISNITSINALDDIEVGSIVTGAGIPDNSYVMEIIDQDTIKISNVASATTTDASLNISSVGEFEDDEIIRTVVDSDVSQVYNALTSLENSTGRGSRANVQEGVYYVKGHYVHVEEQEILLSKYNNKPNKRIGFDVNEDIVTELDDNTLLDPAAGSPNFNAPGAHRYAITLDLASRDLDSVIDASFIEVVRVAGGIPQLNKSDVPQYNELNKQLAQRMDDHAGNFFVKHFPIDIREHLKTESNRGIFTESEGGDESKLALGLEPGKAYIEGFLVENISKRYFNIDKARDTDDVNNIPVETTLGNYIDVNNLSGTFNVSQYNTVNILGFAQGDGSYPGATIGTANVRAVQFQSGTMGDSAAVYRLWLFNVQMEAGSSFADDAKGLAGSGSPSPLCDFILDDGKAVLKNRRQNISIFPMPNSAIATLKDSEGSIDTNYRVQRYFSGNMTGTSITLNASSNEFFSAYGVTNYQVSIITASGTASGNGYSNGDVINLSDTGNSVTLAGSPTGSQVVIDIPDIADSQIAVIATLSKSVSNEKTKTLNTNTETTLSLDGDGIIQLSKADIYRVISVTDDSDSSDITDQFQLDNGQRDNFYDRGRLLNTGTTPSGTVTVEYEFFTHGSGDYFSVDSYNNVVDYDNIPEYYSVNKNKVYRLSDCLDFRPRINDAGTDFSPKTEFVAPSDFATVDYSYYLGRIDLFHAYPNGTFEVIKGDSARKPKRPSAPSEGMTLYTIRLDPYTFSPSNVATTINDIRRYTMKDVGTLERRIEKLEEFTSLNLLEKDTADLFVDDGTGLNRFKSGFFVENFRTNLIADSGNLGYKASIEPETGELRPSFSVGNLDLDYETISNVVIKDDMVMLDYTEQDFIIQDRASKIVNVNPFNAIIWEGDVVLKPSSDNWVEIDRIDDNVTYKEGNYKQLLKQNKSILGTQWNAWESNWIGSTGFGFGSDGNVNTTTKREGNTTVTTTTTDVEETRTGVFSEVVPQILRETVNDKVVSVQSIPYIRSREVMFTGEGFRPNIRLKVLFDEVDVTQYCRPVDGDYGQPIRVNKHGEAEGYFNIPNQDDTRFRTGTRVFRLEQYNPPTAGEEFAFGESVYTASGTLQTKQFQVIATRNGVLRQNAVTDSRTTTKVRTDIQQINQNKHVSDSGSGAQANETAYGNASDSGTDTNYCDPVAQTFLIEEREGCFVTSVDVFFFSKDENIPIRLEVRTVENGIPTPYVVPNGTVTLRPEEVSTSLEATAATTFTFKAPIYLRENREYAIILITNTNEYRIFVSRTGERDFDGRLISEQPYLGSFFMSQNSATWTPIQEEDMKFVLRKAVFNIGSDGVFMGKLDDTPVRKLVSNPISTTNASNTVRVYMENHGLRDGDSIVISGATEANGLLAAEFNGTKNITVVNFNEVQFNASTNANLTGTGGGNEVTAKGNTRYDTMRPNIQTLKLNETGILWGYKTTDTNDIRNPSHVGFSIEENTEFLSPRLVLSDTNNPDSNFNSFELMATLTSRNPNVSPIIDLERFSTVFVGNVINNDTTDETEANHGDAEARYFTIPIELEETSETARVYVDVMRPAYADFKVYIRTLPETIDEDTVITDREWMEMGAIQSPTANPEKYREYIFEMDNMEEYSVYQIKIVMTSTNSAQPPIFRNLRAIAFGT